MTKLRLVLLLVGLVAGSSSGLLADDLTGSEVFLCSALEASVCPAGEPCHSQPAWTLNIPQFIVIDLTAKTISTTQASGENRKTPIRNLEREDGLVILQGVQNARAFSFVITEATGMASIAIATDDEGLVIVGACTPK